MGIKGQINSNTVIVGDLTPQGHQWIDLPDKKINQETSALSETLDQMALINISRAFNPNEAKYTFFSNAHRTFSSIDNMLGHKTSLNKFKKVEIISSIFSDHNGTKLEINHKKTSEKHTKDI